MNDMNVQVVTKKRPTLAKRFKCPFCANENVVECVMDRKNAIGKLNCRLCAASYQMDIHNLHEPIDVFSEWLDDCEAADRHNGSTAPLPSGAGGGGGAAGAEPSYDNVEYEDMKPKIKQQLNTTSLGLDSDSDED